eukprot:COSAG02_NODE_7280_length_3086_cov_2.910278_2_plen_204_part_01
MDAAAATATCPRHCNHCRAPIIESEANFTVTICHHVFCSACTKTIFISSETCPVHDCGTKLQHSTCVVRERCAQPEMLLVGHTYDAVAQAVGHALAHFQCQQQHAMSLALKTTAEVEKEMAQEQNRSKVLEQDLQAMSVTVAELSKQLEAERHENAAADAQLAKILALQAQVNGLTRTKLALENRVHELESAAKKDDSDEDWSC